MCFQNQRKGKQTNKQKSEGREREREKREIAQEIRAPCKHKEPSIHVKAQSWAPIPTGPPEQRQTCWPAVRQQLFSKSLCLKGTQWEVRPQNSQSPPEPPPRMHVHPWRETGYQEKPASH